MGKFSRDKGARVERLVVKALQLVGLGAERVPLSGASRGRFSGDVSVPVAGRDLRLEVKSRANAHKQIYDWLEPEVGEWPDALVLHTNNRRLLLVCPLSTAAEIAWKAEQNKHLTTGETHGTAIDPS